MIIGYVAKKSRLVPDNTATVLSKLENYFFVPALIIKNFMEYCTVESITEQYKLILYCLVALAIALAIAIPLSKVFAGDDIAYSLHHHHSAYVCTVNYTYITATARLICSSAKNRGACVSPLFFMHLL